VTKLGWALSEQLKVISSNKVSFGEKHATESRQESPWQFECLASLDDLWRSHDLIDDVAASKKTVLGREQSSQHRLEALTSDERGVTAAAEINPQGIVGFAPVR
jgi:hypothetical protein